MLPKAIPNLNQSLFNGVSNFEFVKPSIKKIKLNGIDQIIISLLLYSGKIVIIKKTTKKTNPKLLFELIFILFLLIKGNFIQFICILN